MAIHEYLVELAQSFDVELTSSELGPSATQWTLTLKGFKPASGVRSFSYVGDDLARVITRAWGGERPDRSE